MNDTRLEASLSEVQAKVTVRIQLLENEEDQLRDMIEHLETQENLLEEHFVRLNEILAKIENMQEFGPNNREEVLELELVQSPEGKKERSPKSPAPHTLEHLKGTFPQ